MQKACLQESFPMSDYSLFSRLPKQMQHYVLENSLPYSLHLLEAFMSRLLKGFFYFFNSAIILLFESESSDSSSDNSICYIFFLYFSFCSKGGTLWMGFKAEKRLEIGLFSGMGLFYYS